jgi:phage gpG-like protein
MKPSVKYNFDNLNKFVKMVSDKHIVKIGIMGEKASEVHTDESGDKTKTPLTNVEIGVVHELGSIKRHIPIRSFILMPLSHESKKIIARVKTAIKTNIKWFFAPDGMIKILETVGVSCEQAIGDAFETGGFGSWLITKNPTPLRKTGQLMRSITSKVVGK